MKFRVQGLGLDLFTLDLGSTVEGFRVSEFEGVMLDRGPGPRRKGRGQGLGFRV